MKYCKYCGAELSDDAAVCTRCGHSLYNGNEEKGHHGLGIAGFVLSLLGMQPLALIFSIIGLAVGKRNGNKTGLAIAGLVLSIISIVFGIILYISIIIPALREAGLLALAIL